MVTHRQQQPTAQPFVPESHTLTSIRAALPFCKGCELYRHATQAVPGEGRRNVALLLLGEGPGSQEDIQGRPFVGPAGTLLRRMMEELSIDERVVYITNAVKHFKYVQRGRMRLNQNPRTSEVNACRPWLLAEFDAVRPQVVLCLGASAARSLLGGTFALMKDRGKLLKTPYIEHVMATIHPSAILRARDEQSRTNLKDFLRKDLALAYQTARQLVSTTA